VQVAYQGYAIWLANLMYQDTKSVIKVVRYGLTIACFPKKGTVRGIERNIAQRWPHNSLFTHPR
jgi:hypothetical protein